ncbi:MAG: PAS domain S-box protein [Anaerolineae bacterium]|nr:PAS domain S-box protein [Anaerolineae bacterium]
MMIMNNYSSILALIQNAALLLAMAVVFDTTIHYWKIKGNFVKQALLGCLLGGIGIVLMNTPWKYGEGLIFDTRSILLSLSGLFFGTIPALIAMAITAVYRLSQGGAYITGISVIIVTSLLGIGWRYLRKGDLINLKWWQFYLFGGVIHVVMLLLMFTQPIIVALPLLSKISLPILIIYPAATLLLGLLMQNRIRRETAVEEIQKSRGRLKSMVDILQNLGEDDQAFNLFVLEEAVKLMESELGFIFNYSEDTKQLTLSSWSKKALEICTIPVPQTVYELEKTGIWGEPVRQRKPIIINNFQTHNPLKKGYPTGHPEINKLLEVPVFIDNKIVAVVGVANKAVDYTDFDVDQLTLLMEMVWKAIERKKVIENLRKSEENYRQLFNQNIDGIFITNSEGDCVDVNDSGCSMLGYSLDELKQDYKEIFRNDDRTIDIENVTKEISPGRRLIRERKLQTKSGNLIDVEITTLLLSDGRIQKVVRNITERKKADQIVINAQHELQALLRTSDNSRKALLSVIEDQKEIEEALSKSEKSYRTLFENITQGFALHKIILDESGKPVDYQFVAVNPAYEKLTGLSAEKIIGKTVLEALPGVEQSWIDTFGEVAISGNAKHFEDYTGAIGKYYDVTAFCPEIGFFAVVISDITERKKYELDIQNFNLALENRGKDRTVELENANHELESFSYSISHDLRAPLRSIHGFSQIILEDYSENLDPEVNHYFNLIRKNAMMMGNLVDDLLSFSRLGRQSLNHVNVDSASIVKEVIESLQSEIRDRKINISMVELPEVKADPSLLRQIFVNLISNSIKFSRDKIQPEIEVGFETQIIEDGLIHAYFYVKDNGVGFDMKFYDKLFGVFQRLHRAEDYEGTGVGLAIVDRIVKKHGGNIWAESAIGEGTTFYFTLGESENGK